MKEPFSDFNVSDAQIDEIYDYCDALFRQRKFEVVNKLLRKLTKKLGYIPLDIVFAYLTVTSWAKNKLPHRAKFFKECSKLYSTKMLEGLE